MEATDRTKSGRFDGLSQYRQAVTPQVMGNLVLQAPQGLEGRYGDHRTTARHQYTRDLTQGQSVIVDMLDNISRQDKLETRILERKVTYISAVDDPQSFLRAEPDRFVAEI